MKIEQLKPGMVVYDVHSYRMGNTTVRSMGCWAVKILEVHERKVVASWNGNQPQTFYGPRFKWRAKKPEMVRNSFGACRLKTRAEKAAGKAAQTA